jgi:hypothetical protein
MIQRASIALIGVILLVASPGCGPSTTLDSAADLEATISVRVEATLAVQASGLAATTTTEPTTSPGEITSNPSMPIIAYFNCDPCVVEPGGSTTLSWNLSGATAAYFDGQGITAPGSRVVYPDQTTTYRLTAVNDIGRSEKTVTVEVSGLPIIHYLTCLPCEIPRGEQATLSWDLSGATAAYLDGHGVTAPDSVVVAPDQTTTYRLEAVSERGSVQRLITVTVTEGGNPQAVSQALDDLGYDVRSVGRLSLASGGETIGVIMAATADDFAPQEVANQFFEGFKAVYDNYPDQTLTVGLYDGARHISLATVESASFEALLRGQIDGIIFWKEVTWNVWDDWTACWLTNPTDNFALKRFGY